MKKILLNGLLILALVLAMSSAALADGEVERPLPDFVEAARIVEHTAFPGDQFILRINAP